MTELHLLRGKVSGAVCGAVSQNHDGGSEFAPQINRWTNITYIQVWRVISLSAF